MDNTKLERLRSDFENGFVNSKDDFLRDLIFALGWASTPNNYRLKMQYSFDKPE